MLQLHYTGVIRVAILGGDLYTHNVVREWVRLRQLPGMLTGREAGKRWRREGKRAGRQGSDGGAKGRGQGGRGYQEERRQRGVETERQGCS